MTLYSLIYQHKPAQRNYSGRRSFFRPHLVAKQSDLKHRSLKGFKISPEDDYLKSRKPVLVNNDCKIILSAPRKSMTDYFFKNADSDEMIFIHKGSGTLRTMYGNIPFGYGDYLIIPRGTVYQLEFEDADNRLLIVESSSPITTPRRYRNQFGQLTEHSPLRKRYPKAPGSGDP